MLDTRAYLESQVNHQMRLRAQQLLSLSVDEFLRRFLLHFLPKSFVCIRNLGFLANRKRSVPYPFAFSCWDQHHSRKPNNMVPASKCFRRAYFLCSTARHYPAIPFVEQDVANR